MSTYPYLIGPAGFGQVSYPFDAVIVVLFKYFQKPHNQPRRSKHKDLEINVYGRSSPDLASRRAGKLRSPVERELLSSLDSRNPAHALITEQKPTGCRIAYFHTTTFSSGTYFAFPVWTLQSTLVVFRGVGMRRTTLVADSLFPKFVFRTMRYVTCVVPTSLTVGITRRGSFTFEVDR